MHEKFSEGSYSLECHRCANFDVSLWHVYFGFARLSRQSPKIIAFKKPPISTLASYVAAF
ncbi:hypothetical protein OZX59_07025 [Lactobacillus sp. ESL0681]|nr:hypothetical protein [Lactobacillus sp. ESL0681]WEV39955.1 hypothetical protein OZX59_07025 [Lactobacillus sp. ESL0681]